jgi:hypothetical protein
VATVGAATANSYADLTFADAYFEAHPQFEVWDRLYSPAKQRALILATTQIDNMVIDGEKAVTSLTAGVPDQALRFPRSVDYDDGAAYIPVIVKRATCEQAMFLAERGGSVSKRRTMQLDGVKRVKIADIEEEYDTEGGVGTDELSPRVYQMLNSAGLIAQSAGWA